MECGNGGDHVEDGYVRAGLCEPFGESETAASGATCDESGSAFE